MFIDDVGRSKRIRHLALYNQQQQRQQKQRKSYFMSWFFFKHRNEIKLNILEEKVFAHKLIFRVYHFIH